MIPKAKEHVMRCLSSRALRSERKVKKPIRFRHDAIPTLQDKGQKDPLHVYLRNMQAEGVEGDENALVHHHRARAVGLADVRVGGVAVDRVSARQVSWIRVDRRVHRYPSSDPQDEHARHECLF